MPRLTCHLLEDADPNQFLDQLISRRIACASPITRFIYRHDRMLIKTFEHSMSIASRVAEIFRNHIAMLLTHRQDASRSLGCLHATPCRKNRNNLSMLPYRG